MDYNSKIKLNEKIALIENKEVLKSIFEVAKQDLIINGKKNIQKIVVEYTLIYFYYLMKVY